MSQHDLSDLRQSQEAPAWVLLISKDLDGTCPGMHNSPEVHTQHRLSHSAPETALIGREHPFVLSQHSRRPMDCNIRDWLRAGSMLQHLANSEKGMALKKQE